MVVMAMRLLRAWRELRDLPEPPEVSLMSVALLGILTTAKSKTHTRQVTPLQQVVLEVLEVTGEMEVPELQTLVVQERPELLEVLEVQPSAVVSLVKLF